MRYPALPFRSLVRRTALLRFFVGKSLIFALLLSLVAYVLPGSAHAQQNTSTVTYSSSNVDPDVPRNAHTNAQLALWGTFSGISCLITGNDLLSPTRQCIGPNPMTGKIGYWPRPVDGNGNPVIGGALGSMSSLIAVTYTPPASGIGYTRYVASTFGIDKAHAQSETFQRGGYGASALSPMIHLFEASRNIAYLFFAVAMVVIGLAIMLRVKIDPRTVMSIQNQIPKIIVGLILITFSFAIVGFMIDMMWVSTYLSIDILTEAQRTQALEIERLSQDVQNVDEQQSVTGKPILVQPLDVSTATEHLLDNPVGYADSLIDNVNIVSNVGGAIGGILGQMGSEMIDGIPGLGYTSCISGLGIDIGGCFTGLLHNIFTGLGTIIAYIIIFVSLLIVLFRIWFMLIRAYAQIVIATIAAPLWIAAGLFPGSKLSFGSWFKNILSSLLVFPATVIFFLLAAVVIDAFKVNVSSQQVGVNTDTLLIPPLVGGVDAAPQFGVIVGFGIILMIPDLMNMLKDAIKAPSSQYGGHFRSRLMAGNPLSAVGGLASVGTSMYYMKNVPVVAGLIGKMGEWNLNKQKETPGKPLPHSS